MPDLAERIRAVLPPPRVREVRMFGGLALMLDDRMLVCAQRGDRLLVRVAATRDAELATRPDAGRLRMGSRELGTGWILVDAAGVADEAGLTFWLDEALAHHAAGA